MGSAGQWALRILLFIVCAGFLSHLMAIATSSPSWRRISRYSLRASFLFAAIASAALVTLLIQGDLRYSYVAEYTSQGLALVYRVAAFWGGNAGSMLFWIFVLTLYAMVVSFAKHPDSDKMLPLVSLVLSFVTLFFVVMVNFAANPFERLPHAATAGNGLNPVLQNPGMTVHPVNVYLGFVGFTVPFAYAMAGLALGKTDDIWVTVTRRWTLISWLFLSIGIVYGAHWSYQELGWGGYWAWDPIENASLLPWLTATAFLHSAVVQEKRGLLKRWNVVLVTLTFLLTLLGTFLTRSGVLWSIHAFANGPLGTYFLIFLCIVTIMAMALIALRWPLLGGQKKFEAVVAKETSFLLNNVLFLGITFAVLWGTVFPIISEATTGQKMMVSASFYNQVTLPISVAVLLLMGVGPLMAWRKASLFAVAKVSAVPMVVAVVAGVTIAALLKSMYGQFSVLSLVGIIAAVFALFSVLREFTKAVRARQTLTQDKLVVSAVQLVRRNRRRYGGYVVHVAMAVMALGVASSGSYHVDVQQALRVGQTSTSLAGYTATFDGMGVKGGVGSRTMYANLVVQQNGRTLGVLQPSATFYTNGQEPNTNVALFSRPFRDYYVVMLGTDPVHHQAVFDFHVNPLVEFIWYGGYLFILGTLISLWPERRQVPAEQADELDSLYRDLAELEYDFRVGKTLEEDYASAKSDLVARISQIEHLRAALRADVERELARMDKDLRRGGASG